MKQRRPIPNPKMFSGIVREVVDLFAPHTEGDHAAIAAQFLIGFGNLVGRVPCFYVGETTHHLNEFLVVVGTSSRSRKGDSKNVALRTLELIDADWAENVGGGLSSAEGLIYAVRDPRSASSKDGTAGDAGATDKRRLICETEFSSPLKQFERSGNTLSPLLRDVWDGRSPLQNLIKNSPLRASDAHISIIGHTTVEDLRDHLSTTDAANGLGNRFMFILAHRSQLLACPTRAPAADVKRLTARVAEAVRNAETVREIRFSADAKRLWEAVYPKLTRDKPGLLGSLLARAEAHVLRLSALYALLAQHPEVGVEDLEAALAFWDFVEASTTAIFAGRTGSRAADEIMTKITVDEEMDLTTLRKDLFSNHIGSAELQDAISLLEQMGIVSSRMERTGGRPRMLVKRTASLFADDEVADGVLPREDAQKARKAQEAPTDVECSQDDADLGSDAGVHQKAYAPEKE